MDIKTIMFCLFIINLFLGLFLFLIKNTQKTFPGVNDWIVSDFLISIGYLLIFFRGTILDIFSIILAQNLFIIAAILRLRGIKDFFSKKISSLEIFLTATIYLSFFLSIIYFTYIYNSMFIRTVVVISYFATLSLITGILIIKNRPKSENIIYIFTATVFFIYSSILIVRVLVWLLFPSVREVFNSAFINSFQFFASMVIDILWTTLFFVINNQRLNLSLNESNTKYSLIFNHSFAGILLINQEGRYFDINPAFCRITGYSFDEIFDKPVGFLTHPEDSYKIKKALKDLLTGKIDTYNDKTRIINKSGNIIWLTLNAKIYKPDEILQFIQVEIFDITTQVEMEQIMFEHNEKLANAKNMAEKANKAKSEFLSNMSHEIRTPLNGILGFTGILLEEENNKEKRDMLKLMEQSGKMLLNIIDDILSLSKIEAGKYSLDKRRLNLTNFLSTLSEIYKKQATSKNLKFFFEYKDCVKKDILIAETPFTQILNNLLSNAIKFTENGFIKLSAILTENHLTIIIKDTGLGINLAKQEKLFEPFEQGNNPLAKKYSGTGLGLAIVKRLIDLLNGKIEVDTKLNHGTEFKINIPIEIVNERTILTSNNNKIESNKKLRIILAEDMKINQLLIEKIISKENPAWELTTVENGNDLIEKLKEKEYDIILMDIKMPRLNGIETTKIIREQLGNKDIVIIAVSAYALDENIAIALDAGVNSYVSKPINKDELIEKIIMYTSARKE